MKKLSLDIIVDSNKTINCHPTCPKLVKHDKGFTKAWCTLRNGNKDTILDFPNVGPEVYLRSELCFSLFGRVLD